MDDGKTNNPTDVTWTEDGTGGLIQSNVVSKQIKNCESKLRIVILIVACTQDAPEIKMSSKMPSQLLPHFS